MMSVFVPVIMLPIVAPVIMMCVLQSTMAFSYNRKQQNRHNNMNNDNILSIDKEDIVTSAIDETSAVNRRGFFSEAASILLFSATASTVLVSPAILIGRPNPSNAIGEGEERMVFRRNPTAPVGALIPAVQQRLLLEVAIDAAKSKNTSKIKLIIPELVPKDITNNYDGGGDYSIIGASKSRKLDAQVFKLYDPGTVLRGDLTRAAMNLYQTNLNYNSILGGGDPNNNDATAATTAFTVTDPRWKKSYIRANDGLPDIQKVIGADLDLRQLLRNDVQQKLDDAAAELYYTSMCDEEELLTLLLEAAVSFDKWLDRIRYGDVRDAIEKAGNGERPKIYDTYTAGFRPPI